MKKNDFIERGMAGSVSSQKGSLAPVPAPLSAGSARPTRQPRPVRGEAGTKSRLVQVTNWEELAGAARYRANALAKACHISVRELERFFLGRTGKTPHQWLNELRQMEALRMLAAGKSVKEISFDLKYSRPANFSRDFKRFHGRPPTWVQTTAALRSGP
jgi:AraC-like DNA-binding protein